MKFSVDETRDFPGSRVSAENVTLLMYHQTTEYWTKPTSKLPEYFLLEVHAGVVRARDVPASRKLNYRLQSFNYNK